MAILTKRAGTSVTPPATTMAVVDQEKEKPKARVEESEGRFLALRDGDHRYSDLEEVEGKLLAYLGSPTALATVQAISPELAKKALDSARAYVSDRSDPRSWAELILCDPRSIVDSVRDLVAVGLVPNAVRGTGFLAP